MAKRGRSISKQPPAQRKRKAEFVAGFDPGGRCRFGWCVLADEQELPLTIIAAGTVSAAGEAKAAVDDLCRRKNGSLQAAGIDAPLFWDPLGPRKADTILREVVSREGGRSAVVMSVNSLWGSCLVQGMMLGLLLRRQYPDLPITEAHPKAILEVLGRARPGSAQAKSRQTGSARAPARCRLAPFVSGSDQIIADEHTRDAAWAALTAWEMLHKRLQWTDLYERFGAATLSPLAAPLAFYFPG